MACGQTLTNYSVLLFLKRLPCEVRMAFSYCVNSMLEPQIKLLPRKKKFCLTFLSKRKLCILDLHDLALSSLTSPLHSLTVQTRQEVTFEQHSFEWCRSTYPWIFFNKYSKFTGQELALLTSRVNCIPVVKVSPLLSAILTALSSLQILSEAYPSFTMHPKDTPLFLQHFLTIHLA